MIDLKSSKLEKTFSTLILNLRKDREIFRLKNGW